MRKTSFVAMAVLAALVTAAPLASAQGRHRGSGGDGGNGGDGGRQRFPSRAEAGSGGGDRQRGERQAQPRDSGRVEQPRAQQPRAEADNGRREAAPQERHDPPATTQRNDNGNRRADVQRNGRDDGRRADGQRDNRNDGRSNGNRYGVQRNGPIPRYRDGDHRVYVQPRHNYYVYRYPSYRYYGGTRYYGYRYYDPYFAGSFYWSNHSWRAQSYYGGSSWDNDLGKLRLDIDQRDAEVYIDGYYAGVIDDFDGVLQGLRLEPGNYAVQVALPGFEPLDFDVHITPGRTTTYRGSLLSEP